MIHDATALKGIFEAYVANPSLVSSLYIDEKDLPIPDPSLYYRWMLEILHICSNKGYKEFTEDLIEDIIDNHTTKYNPPKSPEAKKSLQEQLKNNFREIQKLVRLNPDPVNAQAHYDVIQKCIVLTKLQDKGYDVSPFYYSGTDPAKCELAKKAFDKNTAEDILDFYAEATSKDVGEIKDNLSITSPYQVYAARNIPGSDKKSVYLIGKEASDSDPRAYVEWMELGTFNSVIGAAKAGKTQLMMQMAYAIQNGFDLWGLPTKKASVLYVDFELTPPQIAKRFVCLRKYFGWKQGRELTLDNTEDMDYLSVSKAFGEGKVDLPGILERCKAYKKEKPGTKLIVFDCFYTFAEGDPNLEQDAKGTLQKLKALVDTETTVCYVHHTNKAGFNDMGDVIYAAGGSGVHGKIVDSTYVVYPHQNTKTKDIDYFRIATTGRSSCGDTINCQRDKGSFWLFDMLPPDGNQQPTETTFAKPPLEEDPDQDQELNEAIDQAKTEFMENDPNCLENYSDPDARAASMHENK